MPGTFVVALVVLLAVAAGTGIVQGVGGPDPAKWLLHQSGFFALIFLVSTLAVSPVARAARRPVIVAWRRPIGLAAFFLATSHVLVYVSVYQGLSLSAIIDDIAKRPYILVGLGTWMLLVPLAATSTRAARRRMGIQWTRLHRAIYLIVPLAIAHQGMAQKADLGETLIFSAFVGCFLIERMVRARR